MDIVAAQLYGAVTEQKEGKIFNLTSFMVCYCYVRENSSAANEQGKHIWRDNVLFFCV